MGHILRMVNCLDIFRDSVIRFRNLPNHCGRMWQGYMFAHMFKDERYISP